MAGYIALMGFAGSACAMSQTFSLRFHIENQTAYPVRLCSLSADDCFPVAAHGSNGWMGNPEGDLKQAFLAWRLKWGIEICGKRVPLADNIDYSVSKSFWGTEHIYRIILTEKDYARLCGAQTANEPAGAALR